MKKHTILFMLLTACLFAGCIKDDLSDCRRSFTLQFRYLGDGTSDIFPEKVTKVHLYVYDTENRLLVRSVELDHAALQRFQGIRFDDLEPGSYQAVCWGNAYESTTLRMAEQFYESTIAAPEYHAGTSVDTNDELYYAKQDFTLTRAWTDQQAVCDFQCAHIDMKVRLEGFDNLVLTGNTRAQGDGSLRLQLDNLPGYYDFNGNPFDEQTLYEPALVADADVAGAYETTFYTLRYGDDTNAQLHLIHPLTGGAFYTLSLSQFLEDNDLSVEDEQEEAVEILIRLNTDGVSVSVSPFEEEDVHPGLDERDK